MSVREAIFAIVLSCVGALSVRADLVVDDFSVGAVVLNGPQTVVQSGLSLAHVVGGQRTISATQSGDTVEVLANGGLQYTSHSGYGLTLTYGDINSVLIANPQADGDRLVLRFSGTGTQSARLAYLHINTSATGPNYVVPFYSELGVLGNEGSLEVLLKDFPANFTHINQIVIEVDRAASTGGFTLNEMAIVGPPLAGDFNRDGIVDAADYEAWRSKFGQRSGPALFTADGNGDRVVDVRDYVIWRDSIGSGGTGGSNLGVAVPEPAAVVLAMMASLIGVWSRRRR